MFGNHFRILTARVWNRYGLSCFSGQKIKSRLFSPFFIHTQIDPECSEMDNFDKKRVVADLPDTFISKISIVVLTTKTQIYITEKWF